jgi:putative DNA primase/helicase
MERKRPAEQPLILAQAAMNYARMGWPVFPLAGKLPYQGTHGHLDATTDLQTIERMWQEHPFANIGLATGEVSGVIVLDLDPRNAEKHRQNLLGVLEKQYGTQFRDTRTVRTAHGGLHLYYQHPRDGKSYPNAVKLNGLSGIDVRGDGGYVVLPPSRLYNSLSYQWGTRQTAIAKAPDWLLSLLLREREEVSPKGDASRKAVAANG